jgi:hypothetical protein
MPSIFFIPVRKHREINSTPQQAWDLAKKENRWALRPAPRCPWWPYVFSQRTRITVGSDSKVAIGSQRLAVEVQPGTKVIRCHHPNGDITVLKRTPTAKYSADHPFKHSFVLNQLPIDHVKF